MAKKYKVLPGFKNCIVHALKPLHRENGEFDLSKCSQKELKYLHDVIKYEAVIMTDDEGQQTEES